MIEPRHPKLSVKRQCALLGLARASYYHQPQPEPGENLQRRPSLVGYLNIIYPNKLQIIGIDELKYLDALDSRQLGFLLESDVIVPHKDELLFVALNEAKAMATGGWRAPHKRLFPVAGRSGIATMKGSLVNMRDGGFISAHDFHIAGLIAEVVCGGDVDAGTLVSEEYLMTLERKAFCALIVHPKTQERILGMLSTGKPVRN